jgi:hypothetical protein
MTTIASTRLPETLQSLIDARLDTIDRMLVGRVNREDRLAIVREVESQVFDLLQARDGGTLDRDDVLARLDPPEAYLPDETTGEVAPPRFAVAHSPARPSTPVPGRLPMVSGLLGIIAVALSIVPISVICVAANVQGPTPNVQGPTPAFVIWLYVGSIGVIFLLALLAVILASCARLRGAMAIVGLVTGIIMMLAAILGMEVH